jgi:hypothetical protein
MIHIVLANYRTGSTTYAHRLADQLGTKNWGEAFHTDTNAEEHTPNFNEGDVLKLMGDYMHLMHRLEKFEPEYHILLRKDLHAQTMSFIKPEQAALQFGEDAPPHKNFRDETNEPSWRFGDWWHMDYPEKLEFVLDEEAFKGKKQGLDQINRNIMAFAKETGREIIYYEDHFNPAEGYKQPFGILDR